MAKLKYRNNSAIVNSSFDHDEDHGWGMNKIPIEN